MVPVSPYVIMTPRVFVNCNVGRELTEAGALFAASSSQLKIDLFLVDGVGASG